jgi:hypothetical protein
VVALGRDDVARHERRGMSAFSTRCVTGIRLTCFERRVLDAVLGGVLVDERVDLLGSGKA